MDGRVGWWPRHWKAGAFVFFPFWFLYLLLLYPTLYLSRFLTWIVPGRRWRDWIDDHVLLGGAVLPWDPKRLKEAGVGAVINLCAEFRDPSSSFDALGIRVLELPTLDRTAPSPDALRRGVAFLREMKAEGVRTFVHCASGAGRSATLVGCYLVDSGMTPEEAMAHLRSRRAAVALRKKQRDAVVGFAPGGKREVGSS